MAPKIGQLSTLKTVDVGDVNLAAIINLHGIDENRVTVKDDKVVFEFENTPEVLGLVRRYRARQIDCEFGEDLGINIRDFVDKQRDASGRRAVCRRTYLAEQAEMAAQANSGVTR